MHNNAFLLADLLVYLIFKRLVSHLMTHAGRGVYPYLPMATNAQWSFFGGGNEQKVT